MARKSSTPSTRRRSSSWSAPRTAVLGLVFLGGFGTGVYYKSLTSSSSSKKHQPVIQEEVARPFAPPSEYRHASQEKCHGGGSQYAPVSSVPKVSSAQAQQLIIGGHEMIAKGSGDVELVGLMCLFLSNVQHDHGIFGSVGELGVHHGKFTSTLFITARSTEKLVIADVFEQTEKIIDQSGLGDKTRFMEGLQTYGLSASDLHHIHTGSTDEIPFDWFLQQGFEQFRLISVDAGHTAALTFNDLELAFCNALRGAVVVLDDMLHMFWPGVSEGVFHYFAYQGIHKTIYPFLFCEGKLFMTNDLDLYLKYYNAIKLDPKVNVFVERNATRWGGSSLFTVNGYPVLICHRESGEDVNQVWSSLLMAAK